MPDGDISRSSFRPEAHFSSVRMQQGRVQLDADWNEQVDIASRRDRAAATDMVGPAGAPARDGGFGIRVFGDGADLLVSPGRLWVHGVLCDSTTEATRIVDISGSAVTVTTAVLDGAELGPGELVRLRADDGEETVCAVSDVDGPGRHLAVSPAPDVAVNWARLQRIWSLRTQPDLPRDAPEGAEEGLGDDISLPGDYLIYLDTWERPITALEDPAIREVALGGPDTTTRTKTVWQLRPVRLGEAGAGDDVDFDGLLNELKPTGVMAARARRPSDADDDSGDATAGTPADDSADEAPDLCRPITAGGYRGADNQLYRVQIRSVDEGNDGLSFVWSRHNGSVTTEWTGGTGASLDVRDLGRDAVLGFASGQWVELLDDAYELTATPGTLARITTTGATHVTVDHATGPTDFAHFHGGNAKLRRWDSPGSVDAPVGKWVPLEHGIEVRFEPGRYRPGDFWLIPARTATGDIDWPRSPSGFPGARPPDGANHLYAPLALVRSSEGGVDVIRDLRIHFPALIDLSAARIPHHGRDLPGADTVGEAIDLLAQRIIELADYVAALEQHISTLHPDRPPPRRGQRRGRR